MRIRVIVCAAALSLSLTAVAVAERLTVQINDAPIREKKSTFSKVVGNRACIYGINGMGLQRRGFSRERVSAIKQAYRVLVQSRLNTSAAIARLEAEGPFTDDVRALVAFIRSSRRGVILKRRHRRTETDDE